MRFASVTKALFEAKAHRLPEPPTHRLHFTGTCGVGEFAARCATHSFWYHSFYFDNGFEVRGDYDIGRDLASYGFPKDMSGMSVLDIGTGSGWFATYFEQRGAVVTTVDARGYCDFDVFGRPGYPDVRTEKSNPDRVLPDGRPIYYSPVSGGFWVMKDMLGLRAEYINARVYDLSPALFGGRTFDLVFMGALLVHLRDPIGALMAARSVCRQRLIATTVRHGIPDAEEPPAMMALSGDSISWWSPNQACLLRWFRAAGFARADADGTVPLTVDKPYVDERGNTSGVNQILARVDAYV